MSPNVLPAARKSAHDAAHKAVRWGTAKMGYTVLWPTCYNGVPRFDDLGAEFWSRRAEMPGVELDADRALAYLREDLAPHLAEFAPSETAVTGTYYVPNGGFESTDGSVTWAMVRKYRPQHVLELGAEDRPTAGISRRPDRRGLRSSRGR